MIQTESVVKSWRNIIGNKAESELIGDDMVRLWQWGRLMGLCETLWSWYHAAFCLSRWASKVCNYFTVNSIMAAWRVQDIRRDAHCNQWYDQSDLSIKIRFICNFEDTDNLLASVWWSGCQSTHRPLPARESRNLQQCQAVPDVSDWLSSTTESPLCCLASNCLRLPFLFCVGLF